MKKISILMAVLLALSSFTPAVFAEQWMPVNMSTELVYDRGLLGGEGCQWTNCIAVSKSNPNFMIFATDVGGLYRSLDEGNTWVECNVGLESRGACEAVIDPLNDKHVLLFGSNASPTDHNGIYISINGAESWQKVFPFSAACQADARDALVFDPTSYDETTGMCMRAYFSTPNHAWSENDSTPKALYMTEDGGYTWNAIPNSENLWDADLAMSDKGDLFVGGQGGFFVSRDKGKTFEKVMDDWTLSVDYVSAAPDNVYVSTWDKVLISTDNGRTLNVLEGSEALPVYKGEPDQGNPGHARYMGFRYFNVSPVNPNHMVIAPGLGEFNWQRWFSRDGGKTWYQGIVDYLENGTHYSTRNAHNAWSYQDENVVFSSGGDWITKSTNGGATYRYGSHGVNVFMGYGITINPNNPDLIFIHGQDYGSFASYDGGETWSFAQVNWDGRGCNVHGGWVVSDNMAFGIGAEISANLFTSKWGTRENEIKIARGYHDLHFEGTGLNPETNFCYQSPTDENILFAGVLRSTDMGETWEKMNGCRGVICHNADPDGEKELYGIDTGRVVVSYDNGETWKKVAELSYTPDSMAYNWKKGYLYATGFDKGRLDCIDVKSGNSTDIGSNVKPSVNGLEIWSVAVDPVDPDIVYIAGAGNWFMNAASVQRSLDGGNTFEVITGQDPELTVIKEGREGPGDANFVLVSPETRELWVTTQCTGTWKIGHPGSEYQGGYYPEEKLYIAQREDGVYLNWYGNGKYDLKNVAFESSISDLFKPHDEWYETLYEGVFLRGVDDGKYDGTIITEAEIDTVAWHAFEEWEKPVYVYELQRSTDGESWETIEKTTDTEFTDTDVEPGNTYYYRVVRNYDGKKTVTKSVTVK